MMNSGEAYRTLRFTPAPLAGIWTASASKSLRMTFVREGEGLKIMLTCSHHYDD